MAKKKYNQQNMPDHVLKRKRLSRTKTVVIFRRNNLSMDDFQEKDGCWVFVEKFDHHGVKCMIKLVIHSSNFCTAFETNEKEMKIKGSPRSFGVFIRFPDMTLPIDERGQYGKVEYHLKCIGKHLFYDNGKRFKKKSKAYTPFVPRETTQIAVPRSVSNAVRHPYSGGGVSPK